MYTKAQIAAVSSAVNSVLIHRERGRRSMRCREIALLLQCPGLHRLCPRSNSVAECVRQARRHLRAQPMQQAWAHLWNTHCRELRPKQLMPGPMQALKLATSSIGWTWPAAFTIHTDLGTSIDLRDNSPAAAHHLRDAIRATACREAARRRPREFAGLESGLHRPHCRRHGATASTSLLFTGGLWDQRRLHAAGYAESRLCPDCGGADDSAEHVFWTCPATAARRRQLFIQHPGLEHIVGRAPPCVRACGLLPHGGLPIRASRPATSPMQ